MYPNLSYLLHDLIGTDRDNVFSIFQTFGMMMVLGFFALGYVLYLELRRKEREGLLQPYEEKIWIGKKLDWKDLLFNTLMGGFITFKLPYIISNFERFKHDASGVVFSGEGNVMTGIIGAVIFGGYTYYQATNKQSATPKLTIKKIYPHERISEIIGIAAFFGLVGARFFSIFENMDAFWADPLGQLFSGSGLTVYGGFILAFIAVFLYVKRKNIDPIHMMDAIAPALMIGYGVGRMGCQLSGDGDWGIVNMMSQPAWFFLPDWAWAYDYPHNVLNEGVRIEGCTDRYCSRLEQKVFPTPLYEIIYSVLIFAFLWSIRKSIQVKGQLFCIYLMLMSAARFLVEWIRVNPRYSFLGAELSQAQFISMGLFAAGVVGWWLCKKYFAKNSA